MTPAPAAALAEALAAAFPGAPPAALGVAVSGGGDSVALLCLLSDWAREWDVRLAAATVDHRLRPEATAEAAAVARLCAGLGVAHATLAWAGWDGRGNLMDAARRARQRLLADWAAAEGLAAVALGHTRDDQAETVLLRLARGAGVDGLSAMAPRRGLWLRPLLAVPRAALRAELRARGVPWAEDPSNADPRFARTRARRALAALGPLGIDAAALAGVAARMASARQVLAEAARAAAERIARVEAGDVLIDATGWRALPDETRARLLAATLRWIAGGDYAPRRADLERLMARIGAAGERPMAATLHGCALRLRAGRLRIAREGRAVAARRAPVGALWDGRWRLIPPEGARVAGLHVAALGAEGLAACPRRPRGGPPRASLLASPAVWDGPWLVAAPLAGLPEGWRAETVPPAADFPLVMLPD